MAMRMRFGLCLVAVLALVTCIAYADGSDECLGLYYNGDLFDKFSATYLSAQVGCPCTCIPDPTNLANAGVWFQVTDMAGINRTNGAFSPLFTNAVGSVSTLLNVGAGVFQVQAFGSEGGQLSGLASPPVALTVYNCAPGVGIAAGGAITLNTCKKTACDNECTPGCGAQSGCIDYECRRATFGLYYDIWKPEIDPKHLPQVVQGIKPIEFSVDLPLPDSRNEQLLFLDPCNPDGAVKIKVTNFRTASLPVFVHVNIIPFWFYVRFEGLKLTGYCEYTIGNNAPQAKYFEAVLSHHYYILSQSPYFVFRNATFSIRVWESPNTTLYQASGEIENGGSRIF